MAVLSTDPSATPANVPGFALRAGVACGDDGRYLNKWGPHDVRHGFRRARCGAWQVSTFPPRARRAQRTVGT